MAPCCLGRSGDRQIQTHRDGLPIRPPIARQSVCFHPPLAYVLSIAAYVARLDKSFNRQKIRDPGPKPCR